MRSIFGFSSVWFKIFGRIVNLRISRMTNFKNRSFHRVKELSKSNQSRYGVSHMYLETKTKRIFGIACVEKKLVFRTEICD